MISTERLIETQNQMSEHDQYWINEYQKLVEAGLIEEIENPTPLKCSVMVQRYNFSKKEK